MAYDKPENHRGGSNVLFGDGSTCFLREDQVDRLLKERLEKLEDLEITTTASGGRLVSGSAGNTGSEWLDKVIVTIWFRNEHGALLQGDTYSPVYPPEKSSDYRDWPLGPGKSKRFCGLVPWWAKTADRADVVYVELRRR